MGELLEINQKLCRIFVVPSQLKAILEYLTAVGAVAQLHHIRLWICSGEPLTPQLVYKFYDYFPPRTLICNYYGSTEVTGDVTAAVFHSREHFVANLIGNNVPLGNSQGTACKLIVNVVRNSSRQTSGRLYDILA